MEYYHFFVHFNEGDYYTCHDLLEEIWLRDRQNLFVKGLLHLSVALYHYSYGNLKGTTLMLTTAKQYLLPYRPFHWSLNINSILEFIENCLIIIPNDWDSVSYTKSKRLPRLPHLYLNLDAE
ncbi:DUF309 domain-containing protein [Bacillus kexueae]|uniref:DUF309 domain-containing protein n=1 Tax=Aeribacillus kexueae TaxID=2078952 RepID=UPI001FAF54B4|nr:DUF309 domain-containing protein [Bacillus kexueae]